MLNCNFDKFKNVTDNIYEPFRKGHVIFILMLLIATNQKKTNGRLFIELSLLYIQQN